MALPSMAAFLCRKKEYFFTFSIFDVRHVSKKSYRLHYFNTTHKR
jgi:hypothetical protein